ncbi:protein RETICULATA-RELATED 4, chloroplastic-like [Primulina tabacum]|uniref:protein RETICULATA-RELATED 4, chloroplastic-like n=1 Tax=Primulina tabacum TaxID=48773 RepID=UPI003F5940B2
MATSATEHAAAATTANIMSLLLLLLSSFTTIFSDSIDALTVTTPRRGVVVRSCLLAVVPPTNEMMVMVVAMGTYEMWTAAEYHKRKDKFFKELEIVFADVMMALVADFMLVYLPAPTVSLRPSLALNTGCLAKFFYSCPENAFQVALSGTSFSLLQRVGAIVRNGAKLFAVGTTSSLVGTVATNAFINNARKSVEHSAEYEIENVPVLSTSVGYGIYMATSSNLRYQMVAGVIEQRILEPMLHQHKLVLSALCFAVRTGNTFLGTLLWVDYARLIGIQKAH